MTKTSARGAIRNRRGNSDHGTSCRHFPSRPKLKARVEAYAGTRNNDELPPIPGKRYFTIGEVSELCGVKPHVLRYWEQEFPQLKPVKRRVTVATTSARTSW